jgi:hypothetical protein
LLFVISTIIGKGETKIVATRYVAVPLTILGEERDSKGNMNYADKMIMP